MSAPKRWYLADDLSVESITILVDSREQQPWELSPLRVVPASLQTGDYQLRGCDSICLERKSLADLLGCVGRDRQRFERELERMKAFATRYVIVECNYSDLTKGGWRGKLTPKQVTGTVASWMLDNPFIFAGDHKRAAEIAQKLLWFEAKRSVRQLRNLLTIAQADR